jgi:hypothetical protein
MTPPSLRAMSLTFLHASWSAGLLFADGSSWLFSCPRQNHPIDTKRCRRQTPNSAHHFSQSSWRSTPSEMLEILAHEIRIIDGSGGVPGR